MVTTRRFAVAKFTAFGVLFLAVLSSSLLMMGNRAFAALSDLSSSLPDDSYKLYLPNNQPAQGNGLNCYIPQTADHGSCHAGGYGQPGGDSHQYITLSKGQINDSRRDVDYQEADTSQFSVYAGDNNSARRLSFNIVARAISDLGCEGFKLKLTYISPNGNGSIGDEINLTKGCTAYDAPKLIPADYFAKIPVENTIIGYKADVRVQIVPTGSNPGARQASFHVSANNGGKMSYGGGGNWVNTYPTNAADDHKIVYSFRPPCDVDKSQAIDIAWDNLDYPSSYQPNKPSVRLIRHNANNFNQDRKEVWSANVIKPGLDSRTLKMNDPDVAMFDAQGRPYSFSLEFDGIRGGNGISFAFPYDSALAKIECPPKHPPATSEVNAMCSSIGLKAPAGRYYKVYVNDGGSPGTVSGSPDYEGKVPNAGEKTFDLVKDKKIVSGVMQSTIIIYKGSTDTSGREGTYTQQTPGPCYSAKCDIDVVENVPGAGDGTNAVQAGKPFEVWVSVTNLGINNLDASVGGNDLSATLRPDDVWGPAPDGQIAGNAAPARIGKTIFPGGAEMRRFTLNAPNDQGSHELAMYPDYWLRLKIGTECYAVSTNGPGIQTYQRYDFDATASSALDTPESPTKATFTSSLTQRGVGVDGTAVRNFYKYNNNGSLSALPFGPGVEGGAFGNKSYSDVYSIPPDSFGLGDGYCMDITLDRGHGWRSGGSYYDNTPATAGNCGTGQMQTVQNRPYVRTYGGDIAAGGGFGANCGNNNAGIHTYMFPRSRQENEQKSGSGSQLAAMALGPITGFMSATIRTTSPSIPNGLTFAHGTGAVSDDTDATLGGNMRGDGWCMPDYYGSTQFNDTTNKTTTSSGADINVNSLADKKQTVVNLNGTGSIKLTGGSGYTKHHTVYVDGNVYISNNIAYTSSYAAGVQAIPSFTLVVKGNIFIDSNVSQLDGLYIAQPNGQANTGRIYTCSSGAAPLTSGTDIYNTCGADEGGNRKQLTVNGAFVAEKVILNRAGYTLRNSGYRETAANSKAAEIFKFSPEMYMSPPVFRSTGTSTSGDYDYLSILAPIL